MNEPYKVALYDSVYADNTHTFRKVGEIIAIRTPTAIRELLTGYRLGIAFDAAPVPHQVHIKKDHIREYGHQPTINLKDFVQRNRATPEEIDEYIDKYDLSEWKIIYEEMKIFSIAQKVEIKAKIKQVFKSKA